MIKIEDINTILLYIFVILLLFCIMYILFYSEQNISFDDNLDSIEDSIENSIYIYKNKEKFESVNINNKTYYILNPPESSRRVSDHHDQTNTSIPSNYPPNGYYDQINIPKAFPGIYDHISSMLDTLQGWSAKNNDNINLGLKWLQMDLGSPMVVNGVVTQGRGPGLGQKLNALNNPFVNQSVTSYQVSYSNDATTWEPVDKDANGNGAVFQGNTPAVYNSSANQNTKISNVFANPVTARYIRIIPKSYKLPDGYTTMRAGVLISDEVIHINVQPYINNIPYIIKNGNIQFNDITLSITNPPESSRRVSDYYQQDKPPVAGSDYMSSRLDTLQGWSSIYSTPTGATWVQMDLGSPMVVRGVVTQGRGPGLGKTLNDPNTFGGQSVTSYKVAYSNDEISWIAVDRGVIFQGNTNDNPAVFYHASQNNTKIGNIFSSPVLARYIRIFPETSYNHTSMRAGLLTVPIAPTTTRAPTTTLAPTTTIAPTTTLTPTTTLAPTTTIASGIYTDEEGQTYLQSLSNFNKYISSNKDNLTNILEIIGKTKTKTRDNNNILMKSITNLYYKQYLETINKINAEVYNKYNKMLNPMHKKIKQ